MAMRDCCDISVNIPQGQRRVLRVVLAVNLVMFLVEVVAAFIATSTALLADSVDMLGDAIVYGFSLYVVARGAIWQARGAMLKGIIMAAFGVGVLVEVAIKIARGVVPASDVMGTVGIIALAANIYCLVLLTRHRADDLNMSSAWTCSRNDVIANIGVLGAAGAVAFTDSAWPDIVIGLGIAVLFGSSAVTVLRDARQARTTHRAIATVPGARK
jgi:Co/Zn/Cd efflux system component